MKTIFIGLICMGLVAVISYQSLYGSRTGKILDQYETGNISFKVRVVSRAEAKPGFVPGAYYVFESSPVTTDQWCEIMTFRHDDQVPIPRNQVHFVNEQIGYIYMGWMFAVTTNSGTGWSVWRADKDLPGWECCNYKLIKDVTVAADGSGVMTLSPIPGRQGEVPSLRTRDYGRHWRPE